MIAWLVAGVAVLAATLVMGNLERRVRTVLTTAEQITTRGCQAAVSVIKPVFGANEHTETNFRSWAEQDYKGPVQLILSFQTPVDNALPIARELERALDVEVTVNPIRSGYTGKMSNLLWGLDAAKHDFLVFSDSDIAARPDLLQRIVGLHLQGAEVISCLMRHVRARNIWGRIYAVFWNFEHMAFIAPSILARGRGATGGTLALSRGSLASLGGLEAFRDSVAEDVAMGRAAHGLGMQVALGPVVDSPVGSMDLAGLLRKFARAALFGLSMGTVGESLQYAVLFCYLPLSILGVALAESSLLAAGITLALCRLWFASRFWRISTGERRLFFEIFLSDLLFLYAWVQALITRRLEWGGVGYRVARGGSMSRIELSDRGRED